MEKIILEEGDIAKRRRNRSKPKHKRESRRNVGTVLAKTIMYVTTYQLAMGNDRRKCQL